MKVHPNWGRVGSFACCACEQEGATFGGVTPAGLAVCKPCAGRMVREPQFRESVTAKAAGIAASALLQRIADTLGLAPPVVRAALVNEKAQGRTGGGQIDEALGLAPGQFAAAWAFVSGHAIA